MAYDRIVALDYGEEKRSGTAQEHDFGELGMTKDGRSYRYIFMDGAVTAGKLLQTAANIAEHDMDLVTAAAAIGATSISVTLGANDIAVDEYKDGFLYVNDGAGEGQLFKIGPHAAVASGGAFAVPIRDEGGVRTAVTASSLCGLMKNPYKDAIVAPTTFTGHIVGATTRDMTDNYYGWAQRSGLAALLAKGTIVIGGELQRGNATTTDIAGAVEAVSYAATVEDEIVGVATLIIAVDTDYTLANMTLAP